MSFLPEEQPKTVIFHESDEYFVNPDMGAVAPARYTKRAVDGSLVVAMYTWRELEAEKGKYDFQNAEQKNHYHYWIHEKNNKYMFSLSLDTPKLSKKIGLEHMDIPRWLYEEMKQAAEEKYQQLLSEAQENGRDNQAQTYRYILETIQKDKKVIEGFNQKGCNTADIPEVGTFYRYSIDTPHGKEYWGGFSPYYDSELMISYHDKLIEKLAERYDNPHTYAVVMGSLGHWGEMHTYYIKNKAQAGGYPNQHIAERYENSYPKYFHQTMVSVRYPRKVAKNNNYGLHSHSFGDHRSIYDWHIDFYENGYTDDSTGATHPAMKDFWKTAPSGGEFLYTGDARYLSSLNLWESIQQAKDTHLTWFNELWYGLDEETSQNQKQFFSRIGYRFVPEKLVFSSSAKAGQSIRIDSLWKNSGTAPFYKDWAIQAVLKNQNDQVIAWASFNPLLKFLMPEEGEKEMQAQLGIPQDIEKGVYKLYLGIHNPDTGDPEIRLAIQEEPENGLYFVGEVHIR